MRTRAELTTSTRPLRWSGSPGNGPAMPALLAPPAAHREWTRWLDTGATGRSTKPYLIGPAATRGANLRIWRHASVMRAGRSSARSRYDQDYSTAVLTAELRHGVWAREIANLFHAVR